LLIFSKIRLYQLTLNDIRKRLGGNKFDAFNKLVIEKSEQINYSAKRAGNNYSCASRVKFVNQAGSRAFHSTRFVQLLFL